MKKVVFLSDMAFDANVSMVKYLSSSYDVYFMSICRAGVEDRIGKISLNGDIVCSTEVEQFKPLSLFLDLGKTFLIRHYSKKEMGWKSLIKKFLVDIKVCRYVRTLKPSAVMVDSLNFPITRFFNRSKVIHLMHDPFPHNGEHNFYRKLSDATMKFLSARYVLFNENQKQEFIERRHIAPKKVFTAFLGVYEILELFGKTSASNEKSKNIFFWGRISPYKGIEFLIEGFKRYLKETGNRDVSLTIAGAGKYHFDVDKAVEGCSQIDVIKRFLSMDEMVNFLRSCFIAVCPYTDATQSGVVMSAFAMKKSVLATAVGGLPEMLDGGNAGMLIKPRSSDDICCALKKLLANPEIVSGYEQSIENIYFNGGKKSWKNGVKGIGDAIESL